MQIKRIADNVHALFFKLTNWNKEPDEKKLHRRESSSNKKKTLFRPNAFQHLPSSGVFTLGSLIY